MVTNTEKEPFEVGGHGEEVLEGIGGCSLNERLIRRAGVSSHGPLYSSNLSVQPNKPPDSAQPLS